MKENAGLPERVPSFRENQAYQTRHLFGLSLGFGRLRLYIPITPDDTQTHSLYKELKR